MYGYLGKNKKTLSGKNAMYNQFMIVTCMYFPLKWKIKNNIVIKIKHESVKYSLWCQTLFVISGIKRKLILRSLLLGLVNFRQWGFANTCEILTQLSGGCFFGRLVTFRNFTVIYQ